MAIHKGIRIHQYLDDWLVRARSHQVCLQHTQDLVNICQELGWLVNLEKSELEPVRHQGRSGPTDTGPVAEPSGQNTRNTVTTGLSGPAVHVTDWFTYSHRKASSPRLTTHETHSVASQKQLESTRVFRKSNSNSQVPAPSLTMVPRRRQCSHRPTITPNKTCSTNIYRRIKRRVGRSLKRTHCKRVLVTASKLHMNYLIPLSLPSLPNLLTQPFNQIPHRNLTNLNLHAWLLDPQQSRSRASLRQWQQELKLLKEDQPDQSMRQSGPFLQSGALLIRWTSGHPL